MNSSLWNETLRIQEEPQEAKEPQRSCHVWEQKGSRERERGQIDVRPVWSTRWAPNEASASPDYPLSHVTLTRVDNGLSPLPLQYIGLNRQFFWSFPHRSCLCFVFSVAKVSATSHTEGTEVRDLIGWVGGSSLLMLRRKYLRSWNTEFGLFPRSPGSLFFIMND